MKGSLAGLLLGVGLCGQLQAAALRITPVSGAAAPVVRLPLSSSLLSPGRLGALSLSPQALVPGLLAPAVRMSVRPGPAELPMPPAPALPLPSAPKAAPAPAAGPTFTQRLDAVGSQLAEPLAAAADGQAGADSAHAAGRNIEETLTGQVSAQAAEDLPPAGPATELSETQKAWLHGSLVQGPAPILTEPGFQALVADDAGAWGQILPWLSQTPGAVPILLHSIYQCLGRVVSEESLSGSERAVLAQALNDRFAAALAAMSRSEALSNNQREVLAEVRGRFVASYSALNELAHHRQAARGFDALQKNALALVAPAQQQAFAEDRWMLPPPIPAAQRGLGADREERIIQDMSRTERDIKDWQFYLDKYLSRYRIAMREPRFSQGLRDRTTQILSNFLGRFFGIQGALHSNLERIPNYSLHASFVNPWTITAKPRRVAWIPDNANLKLVPEPGGYRVEAAFETDIQDDAPLQAVKASIEEYWQGRFSFGGRESSFRAVVSIKKLAPGQEFSAGSLRIFDSRRGVSLASRDAIVLDRNLRYDVPAHEFGHILGLSDEYREGYDPDLAAAVMLQNHASIMGSPNGKVLPRHLKTAYQLLRRRSQRTRSGA
ncbi:MAG: hypothetical protein PHU21_13870 [Elusimicrobia bacterium]|nr:hypothetical protein [Elusimicrobiota bacterium]